VMVNTLTDNRNRTVSEIRHIFSKNGGNLGESGSVAWMFNKKGQIIIDATAKGEDAMLELALEAGAEDMVSHGDSYQVLTSPDDFHAVLEEIKKAGIEPLSAEVTMVPQNTIKLEGGAANQMLKLYDALDDNDDVQNVASNFEIDDDVLDQA
jgi:YebC/PmpR family DNA-binding regulatory protein